MMEFFFPFSVRKKVCFEYKHKFSLELYFFLKNKSLKLQLKSMRKYDLPTKSDFVFQKHIFSFEDKLLVARKGELQQLTSSQQNPSGTWIT